ncbi:hypothetical protein B0H14DRAFT_3470015 [Mycena olivaceomarginata]|nr:hypothetical protein B0H14DRAFT_3470015 [Mycena olivaceomarginata]
MRFAVTAVPTLAAAVCAHSSQGSVALDNLHLRLAEQRHLRRPVLRLRRGQRRRAANATECGSPTNVTYACTNADFQFKSTPRLQAECKAEELAAATGQQQHLPLRHRSPNRHRPFAPFNPAADISGALSSADSSGSGYKSPSATLPARCRSLRPTPGRDSCSRWGLRCWVERTNEYVFLIEMT